MSFFHVLSIKHTFVFIMFHRFSVIEIKRLIGNLILLLFLLSFRRRLCKFLAHRKLTFFNFGRSFEPSGCDVLCRVNTLLFRRYLRKIKCSLRRYHNSIGHWYRSRPSLASFPWIWKCLICILLWFFERWGQIQIFV